MLINCLKLLKPCNNIKTHEVRKTSYIQGQHSMEDT